MAHPDLNLLITLDVLLAEGSVAGAARRLRLSPSAMSRQLARLRDTTGDPLLVRAGRALVPTPRAIGAALKGRSAGAGRRGGAAAGREARSQAPRPHLHRALPRRVRGEFRAGPDRARRQGSAGRAAGLRAQDHQGQRPVARRHRRPRHRRGRTVDRPRSAHPGALPRPLRRRGAQAAPAGPKQGDARPLCGRPAHPGVAARARQGPGR